MLIASFRPALAAEYYAAPNGSSLGIGSISAPWDIRTGVEKLDAGDTLWLRGGIYKTTIDIYQSGTVENPIVIRGYARERAVIDGGNSGTAGSIIIYGSYIWLWDLELMSSDPVRISSQTGSFPSDIRRPSGAVTTPRFGPNQRCKFINLIVHDSFNGLGIWVDAFDAEVYGNIIYNNGWRAPDRGHGHGIYTQNDSGTKRIVDNIIFNGFSHGIHAYTQDGYLNNLYLEGNILFNNGKLAGYLVRNILIGGGSVARNPTVINNYTYYTPSAEQGENNLGYSAGCDGLTATGNYFAGGTALKVVNCSNVVLSDNTFYGTVAGFTPSEFPDNTYHSARPTETKSFVRPNQYEQGRAHIVVYNWNLLDIAWVDVSSAGLENGDSYEIRDAQDFFGQPVEKGVYDGGPIPIPMVLTTAAPPIGDVPTLPAHTTSEFGAFVLRKVPVRSFRQEPIISPHRKGWKRQP